MDFRATIIAEDPASDALIMENNTSVRNAVNRFPALLITLALELVVAFVNNTI